MFISYKYYAFNKGTISILQQKPEITFTEYLVSVKLMNNMNVIMYFPNLYGFILFRNIVVTFIRFVKLQSN